MARGLKQYEKDERANLRKIINDMNRLHAEMGGRDKRPERVALFKAMLVLEREIQRANYEEVYAAHKARIATVGEVQ